MENELIYTEDLSIFNIHESNRDLNELNVERLMSSLICKNLLKFRPILVDEKMRIIDGQHRLEAARRLKVGIYYQKQKEAKTEDIILLNQHQKKWELLDYLKYYVADGKEEYRKFKEFIDNKNISIQVGLAFFRESGKEQERFKNGNFSFSKDSSELEEIINSIQDLIEKIDKSCAIKKKFIHNAGFFYALRKVMKLCDSNVLERKILSQLDLLQPRRSRDGYYDLLKQIYNFRNNNPI
jgi:ParB-like nuclease domain